MNAKSLPSSTQKLKKMSYHLLKKMEDLERGRRRKRIIVISCGEKPCVVVEMQTLRNVFHEMLDRVPDSTLSKDTSKFLKQLDQLCLAIEGNVTSKRRLRKKLVSRTLHTHTAIFRRLKRRKIKLQMTQETYAALAQTLMIALMVWDNDL